VLTHTCGLLLHRALDTTEEGGLNLRRVQWFTNSLNVKSQAAALRLGFKVDGMLRCHRIQPLGKAGVRGEYYSPLSDVREYAKVMVLDGRPGPMEELKSRDSWLACVTWEDWEDAGGVRKHVDELMARR
jgi:RimJ/RimL family protein N-acetyltransferase